MLPCRKVVGKHSPLFKIYIYVTVIYVTVILTFKKGLILMKKADK